MTRRRENDTRRGPALGSIRRRPVDPGARARDRVRSLAVGLWALLAALIASAPSAAEAQDSGLVAALRANRLPVSLAEGRLTGPGADRLLADARAARFTLIGEEHGVREVPLVVRAMLQELRPAGYRVFAIEVSPLAARRLVEATAGASDSRRALDSLYRDNLSWVPFYTMPPEADLLAWALGPGRYELWGLDYEIWADRYWLRWLENRVPPPARDAVRAARAVADSGFAAAARGDPSRIFAFTAPDSLFVALRNAIRPADGSQPDEILDVLQRTAAINRLWTAGRNYESNHARAANLKRHFLERWQRAESPVEPPRVLLKFGAAHMERGLNEVRQRDIGWIAAALAEARGEQSLHVLIVGGPETEHAVFDVEKLDYRPAPVDWVASPDAAAVRAALGTGGFSLFDLRPLRAMIQNGSLRNVPSTLDRAVFGFDLLVVLTGSGPSVE